MTTTQTQDVVNNFFQCLTQRNLDGLTNLFSENIDWYIPGDQEKAPWLGARTSRKEVKEFYELLWKNTEPVDAKIDNIFVQDKNAVVAGEFSTRMLQTNKTVSSLFFIQLTVENNLIVRYRLLEDSYAVSIALT
jgi:uncharacterized protein